VAIPLTSESAPTPAALIDGDQRLFVERGPELVALVREADDSAVERGMVAAGGGREGKRVEYRCVVCGYGIVVCGRPPGCPMCREARWPHVEWRPFSSAARRPCPSFSPPAAGVPRRPAPSPLGAFLANGRGADSLPSPGSSRSIARKMRPREELAPLASPVQESGSSSCSPGSAAISPARSPADAQVSADQRSLRPRSDVPSERASRPARRPASELRPLRVEASQS
jgi:hypothetical protein